MLYSAESYLEDAAAIAQRVRNGEKWLDAAGHHFGSRYGDQAELIASIFVAVDHFQITYTKRLIRERLAEEGPDGVQLTPASLKFILAGFMYVPGNREEPALRHPHMTPDRIFRYYPLVQAYRASRAGLKLRKNGH